MNIFFYFKIWLSTKSSREKQTSICEMKELSTFTACRSYVTNY